MKTLRLLFFSSVVFCAGLLLTLSAFAADDAAERKKLEGTWQGFVVDGAGQNPKQGRVRITEMVITADKITSKGGQGESLGVGTFKLGVSGDLKTIDGIGTGGPAANKTYLGIYSVDGDTLKWCTSNPGKARPDQFKTVPPSQAYLILTRKK